MRYAPSIGRRPWPLNHMGAGRSERSVRVPSVRETHTEVPVYGTPTEDADLPVQRVRRKAYLPSETYPSAASSPWRHLQEELPVRVAREENMAFSEKPTPKKGTIMTQLSESQRKVLKVAAISAITIIAIKKINQVAKLQRTITTMEAQRDFYADVAVRSTSMMNLPQMLHLVDDAVNDMRFKQIIRKNGM